MKLQLALDFADWKKAIKITKATKESIDIIELGTPLIKNKGLGIIKKFKKFKKPILADLKTLDTGFFEAEIAFKAGADIMTVSGYSDEATIKGAIKAARKYKKKVSVDLICIKDIEKEVNKLKKLRPDYICVHTGIDSQGKGETPLKNLKKVSKLLSHNRISVAGGINIKSIEKIKKYNPEIVIVGSAITKARNPKEVALKLKKIILNEK